MAIIIIPESSSGGNETISELSTDGTISGNGIWLITGGTSFTLASVVTEATIKNTTGSDITITPESGTTQIEGNTGSYMLLTKDAITVAKDSSGNYWII